MKMPPHIRTSFHINIILPCRLYTPVDLGLHLIVHILELECIRLNSVHILFIPYHQIEITQPALGYRLEARLYPADYLNGLRAILLIPQDFERMLYSKPINL